MILSSNADLYEFLLLLANLMETQSHHQSAGKLGFAANQASGLSTEFLGEELLALKQTSEEIGDKMEEQQRNDLADAIRQLESAFRAK
jgi:hypothetical protein